MHTHVGIEDYVLISRYGVSVPPATVVDTSSTKDFVIYMTKQYVLMGLD